MESLQDALAATGGRPGCLATIANKVGERGLRGLARRLGLQVVPVEAELLPFQSTLTLSAASLEAYGTGSVAEAVALAAAGPGARLIAARAVSADRMATCALAESGAP